MDQSTLAFLNKYEMNISQNHSLVSFCFFLFFFFPFFIAQEVYVWQYWMLNIGILMAFCFTSNFQGYQKHDEILIFQNTFRKLRLFFFVLLLEQHSLSVVVN